ncbi:MAG: extracellular solute-binding protein [Lachnospiraceae bacterium]|nr:extracellular solute-binding protein [Lachnospiraceae bacterium]
MKFKWRILAVAAIAALVVCSYNIGIRNNIEQEEEANLSYYQTESVYLWYSDDKFTDYFTSAAVAFNEMNPGIIVVPKLIDSENYLETINKASVEGEEYPDILVLTNDALEKAYLSGLASEVLDTSNVANTDHFSQVALDAVTYKGKKVGYPLFFETSVLVYNKTYLSDWLAKVKAEGRKEEEQLTEEEIKAEGGIIEEGEETETEYREGYDYETLTLEDLIPRTIDGIKTFADDYDAPDGVDGVFKWDVSDVFYNYFFAGNYMIVGGPSGDDEKNIDIYNEKTIQCMNIYQGLNQFFSIDADESSYEGMLENFEKGKFVFTIATSDVIAKLKTANEEARAQYEEDMKAFESTVADLDVSLERGDIKEEEYNEKLERAEAKVTKVYEYGFARIPNLTPELESKSLSVTDCLVVNGYSSHKEAANKFAAFVSTEYADHLYAKTGVIASTTDVEYDDYRLMLFQEEYANSIPIPKMVEASNFWVQLEITFTKIWTGENSDELLKKLSEQINNQLAMNNKEEN